MPHATLEAAKASIKAEGSPPDLVEETNPKAIPTAVYVPDWVDLNESGPSPEHGTPSKEPVAIANPKPGSPIAAHVLKADVAWQEFDSTTAPATIAVDGDSPADSVVAEPVTEEHGIAPSAFGPSLLEASLEEEDHEEGWTDLPDSTSTGTKPSADAENGNRNRYGWMQLELRSIVPAASGYLARWKMPRRRLQNVRCEGRRQDIAEFGRVVSFPARAMVQRNVRRPSKVHRGYQARSPPARS